MYGDGKPYNVALNVQEIQFDENDLLHDPVQDHFSGEIETLYG